MGIRKDTIKTNIGDIARDDLVFWNSVYKDYLTKSDLKSVSDNIGVDVRMVTNIFKELGLHKKTSSESRTGKLKKDYVDTKDGIRYNLSDKDFWDNVYYNNYIKEGYSENRLSELLNITRKQLIRAFRYHKYPSKSSEDIKRTIIKSNIDTYGIERPTRDLIIKKKISESHLTRIKDHMLDKFKGLGYEVLGDYVGTREFNTGGPNSTTYNTYKVKHVECGTVFDENLRRIPRCPCCYKTESQAEDRVRKFIESLGFETEKITMKDGDTFKELDIYIPKLNIGFEFNGTIWHSSKYKIKKSYHKNKTELFLSNGIKIYHIWEHDNEILIKSKIKYILNKIDKKYNARDMIVKSVDDINQVLFLQDNHMFGYCSSLFSVGLYSNDELICIMSFRRRDSSSMELVRYCCKHDTSVRGGFSKLLKYSIDYIKKNLKNINNIITFGYRDWCPSHEDSVYSKFFNFVKYLEPTLYYYKHSSRKIINRQKLMKHKLKSIFPETYNENITEEENLKLHGIYAIYNSGIIKYNLNI